MCCLELLTMAGLAKPTIWILDGDLKQCNSFLVNAELKIGVVWPRQMVTWCIVSLVYYVLNASTS